MLKELDSVKTEINGSLSDDYNELCLTTKQSSKNSELKRRIDNMRKSVENLHEQCSQQLASLRNISDNVLSLQTSIDKLTGNIRRTNESLLSLDTQYSIDIDCIDKQVVNIHDLANQTVEKYSDVENSLAGLEQRLAELVIDIPSDLQSKISEMTSAYSELQVISVMAAILSSEALTLTLTLTLSLSLLH